MTGQTDSVGDPPLIAFEHQLAELCRQDKYRDMAEGFSTFVKAHNGTSYLAFEPIPEKIRDHLVEKTHSPSAVMTLTLRKPTWVTELRNALADPSAFQNFVMSLEAAATEIAKQTKKLS